MGSYTTWQEVYQKALNDTLYAYEDKSPDKEEFLETFKTFYDELMAENIITSYPLDPASSRREAINRATVVFVDDVAPRQSE